MLWFLVVMVRQLVLKLGLGIRSTLYNVSESENKGVLFSSDYVFFWLWSALGPTEYSKIKKSKYLKPLKI